MTLQENALRMALDMIECEKYERRHVRWAIIDALKEIEQTKHVPVQVSPLEFVARVQGNEELIGKPVFWAEWPCSEKKDAA